MRLALLITLLLLGILNGCTHKPFQPPRDEYEMWLTPNVSKLDIFKSLLECGMTDPFDGNVEINGRFDLNGYVSAKRCMESLGYVNASSPICSESSTLPACQPDAVIPKSSVERRLNSKYCQNMRKYYPEGLKRCIENKEYSESMCRKAYYKRMECYP